MSIDDILANKLNELLIELGSISDPRVIRIISELEKDGGDVSEDDMFYLMEMAGISREHIKLGRNLDN